MRIPLLAALVAAALALPAAHASPVDLYLNSSGDECVFRTDSNGLTPKIGSGAPAGALAATGQFIDQCAGGSQTPPSDAQIEMLVPSSYAEDSSTPLALTWRASADYCELALPANWSGTPSPLCNNAQSCFLGGTADLTTTAGEGSYLVGLTCSRTGGTAISKTETVQVTVEDEETPPPSGCPAQPLARHLTGSVQYRSGGVSPVISRDVRFYKTTFSTLYDPTQPVASWPQYKDNTITFHVPKDRYIALEFTTPTSSNYSGNMHLSDSGMVPSGLTGSISYSECPGDFGQAGTFISQEKCKMQGIPLSDLGRIGAQTLVPYLQNTCYLEPGKKYYLNILPNCGLANCNFTMYPNINSVQSFGDVLGIEVLDEIAASEADH